MSGDALDCMVKSVPGSPNVIEDVCKKIVAEVVQGAQKGEHNR